MSTVIHDHGCIAFRVSSSLEAIQLLSHGAAGITVEQLGHFCMLFPRLGYQAFQCRLHLHLVIAPVWCSWWAPAAKMDLCVEMKMKWLLQYCFPSSAPCPGRWFSRLQCCMSTWTLLSLLDQLDEKRFPGEHCCRRAVLCLMPRLHWDAVCREYHWGN